MVIGFHCERRLFPTGVTKGQRCQFLALPDLAEITEQQDSKIYRRSYPGTTAVDDVIRGFVDLALHLDRLLLVLGHFDPEDPEVRPSEIQSDKVTLFCWGAETTEKKVTIKPWATSITANSAASLQLYYNPFFVTIPQKTLEILRIRGVMAQAHIHIHIHLHSYTHTVSCVPTTMPRHIIVP